MKIFDSLSSLDQIRGSPLVPMLSGIVRVLSTPELGSCSFSTGVQQVLLTMSGVPRERAGPQLRYAATQCQVQMESMTLPKTYARLKGQIGQNLTLALDRVSPKGDDSS